MLFFIPGFVISALTFPGVIIHEYAHQLFCNLTKTAVYKVCYFQLENPAGYVLHEKPSNIWKNVFISIGPLIVNTGIGFLLGMILIRRIHSPETMTLFQFVGCYLAVSIGMHSFPSMGDANGLWQALWEKKTPGIARVIGIPLVGFLWLGSILSVFWLDLFYGLFVSVALPLIIIN